MPRALSRDMLAPAFAGVLAVVPAILIGFILHAIWTRTPHVPYWDEWETVLLVQHFTQHTLTWGEIWAFHNEHRIVMTNLIDLGLILLTHWNRQIEMTFDVALSVGEGALLLLSIRRGLQSRVLTAVAILPVSLVLLSLAQWETWAATF